jgi:hypothetical protein
MGKIVISENVPLDGVVQDPTGEEGFRHGGWFLQVGDRDREECLPGGWDCDAVREGDARVGTGDLITRAGLGTTTHSESWPTT